MSINKIYQLTTIKKLAAELSKAINQFAKNEKTPLYWSGSVADFVELIYGLIETKRINNGEVELKSAVTLLSSLLDCPVKDCYDTFRAIRRRVDSRTLLLDEMKEKLNERMDRMDEGVRRE